MLDDIGGRSIPCKQYSTVDEKVCSDVFKAYYFLALRPCPTDDLLSSFLLSVCFLLPSCRDKFILSADLYNGELPDFTSQVLHPTYRR